MPVTLRTSISTFVVLTAVSSALADHELTGGPNRCQSRTLGDAVTTGGGEHRRRRIGKPVCLRLQGLRWQEARGQIEALGEDEHDGQGGGDLGRHGGPGSLPRGSRLASRP